MSRRGERLDGLFEGELQTTAMIDVIFILLIFFVSVTVAPDRRGGAS